MQIVVGISYKEVSGEIYYVYVYDVYDITSQKYIEEAVCANTSPENIILELFDKYQNDILKIVMIPPKTKTLNRNLSPLLEEQCEKVVEHFEESLRFIFNLPLSFSYEDPTSQNPKIVVFTVVEKTGVAWLYSWKLTVDPFVYCKREKDFQLNDIDDSFIDKVFKVFNLETKDCHVVYNSSEEDSFWFALEAKQEIFESLQKTQVLTLLGDNRHYRATMYARYLANDPNVKSFIFDKTS
uniref:Uncharacterized protein n=1 Tax=Panagrolaimus sp. JU765 TaxID=591449 RepID=A0AC34R300_9BILA